MYALILDFPILQAETINSSQASMYSRVVILSVRGQLVRKFMLAAHQLGMTKGDYVFLDVEIFQVSQFDSPSTDS